MVTTGPTGSRLNARLSWSGVGRAGLRRKTTSSKWRRDGPILVSLRLAADTSVAVDGVILGKPVDPEAGLAMLAQLSGRSHQVLSAVALRLPAGLRQALSVSRVTFRAIAPAEARAYWDTGEPAGKAGGYAIQGRGALFIERLEGSYSGVMGLPLYETAQLLAQAGLQILSGDNAGQGAGK